MVGSRHSSHLSDTPRGSWASSVFDLRNSVADPLLPSLLSRIPLDTVDNNNQQSRQENRQVFYHLITCLMAALACIYVYYFAYLFICVNLFFYVIYKCASCYMAISLFIYSASYLFLSSNVYPSIFISICISNCMSIWLSIHLLIFRALLLFFLSFYLFFLSSIHSANHSSFHLFVYMSCHLCTSVNLPHILVHSLLP